MLVNQRPSDEVLLKTFHDFTNKPIGYNILGTPSAVPAEDVFEHKYGTIITSAAVIGAIGIGYIITKTNQPTSTNKCKCFERTG